MECSNFNAHVLADGAVIVQADTIELLTDKGKFAPAQAVVLAAAIDMGIEKAQLVTVPILDARLAAFDARFARLEARVESGFALTNARLESSFASLNERLESTSASLNERLESSSVSVNSRIDSLEARMDLRMHRWAVKMIIAMLLGQTALGPIGLQAFSSLRQVLSTLVH
jgi:hypothetical protein